MKLKLLVICIFTLGYAANISFAAVPSIGFLPPIQDGPTEPRAGTVDEKGGVAVGEDWENTFSYAYQKLLEEDEGGVRIVATKTGIGIISSATDHYNIYKNPNVTVLSKRAALVRAFTEARIMLLGHLDGFQNSCTELLGEELVDLQTGVEGAANVSTSSSETCSGVCSLAVD